MSEMEDRMSHPEFVYWYAYYGRKAQREELEMKKAKH